jgi:hypothetical protein
MAFTILIIFTDNGCWIRNNFRRLSIDVNIYCLIRNVLHGLTPPVNINVAPLGEGEIDRIQYPRPRAEHKKRKREEMKNNKSPKLKFSRNNDNEKVPQENEEDKNNETNTQDSDNNNMSINNLMNQDKNE